MQGNILKGLEFEKIPQHSGGQTRAVMLEGHVAARKNLCSSHCGDM